MEHPEEILHSLEEFSKLKPKDIPRELEEYLCFVAKTGDPVYQWPIIKSLFREKLINVITEFYESCPSVEIPLCRNVDVFNCDSMKNFILEKLDTFAAAPFTVQRICELLTTPRKEYNRIDKYMRALEKNILVVSTTEPGNRRIQENRGIVNGIESEHVPEVNVSNDINVEDMDDMVSWPRLPPQETDFQNIDAGILADSSHAPEMLAVETQMPEVAHEAPHVLCTASEQQPYVSIEPVVASESCARVENGDAEDVTVTITPIPAGLQKRRNSIEPVVSSESVSVQPAESVTDSIPNDPKIPTADEPQKKDEPHTPEEASADSTSETTPNKSIEDAAVDDNAPVSNTSESEPEEEKSSEVEAAPQIETTEPTHTTHMEEEKSVEETEEISTTDAEKLPELPTSTEGTPLIEDNAPQSTEMNESNEELPISSSSDEVLVSTTEESSISDISEKIEVEIEESSEVTPSEIAVEEEKPESTFGDHEVSKEVVEEQETPMEVDEKPEEAMQEEKQEESIADYVSEV